MSTKCLGAVVFGAGIAGKVRIRDISSCDSNVVGAKLIGFVSRRQLEIDGAIQITEDEAFQRPDVHVIIVCTEPGAHEPTLRKALANGKHVLVEYPVSNSAAVTTELFSIAKEKGLVLHEENIALLTPSHLAVKEKIENTSFPILKGELQLSANYNGWVEDFEKSGGPFCVNVYMIQTFYDLFGNDLQATGGELEVNEAGFTAIAKLACSKCKDLTLTVQRTKERQPRNKKVTITLEDGTVLDDSPVVSSPPTDGAPQPPKKPGLFMQDFLQFMDKVKGVKDQSSDTARSLHCIALADDIHKFMKFQKNYNKM